MSPARIAWNPTNGVGRKMPPTVMLSPVPQERVISPRMWTVMERGMWPIGTWFGISCSFTSWNLTNFDPRVWWCSLPSERFVWHCWEGHTKSGV